MEDLKRSWMFVPGNRQKMIDKAMGLAVDAIMLDIEDGVIPELKPEARRLIAAALARPRDSGPARYVRVNAIGHKEFALDVAAVVVRGVEGLVLPKVETVESVKSAETQVAELERERGIPVGTVRFLVAVESPRGLMNAYALASASTRVVGLMFGAEDFGRELGLPVLREKEASELLFARSALVVAAAAAHVQSVDGVWPDIQNEAGLWDDARQARRLGFTGKSCFHPGQIEGINAVFSPSAADVAFASEVDQAFASAQARGEGSIAFRGQLIDLPIVERARQMLRLAEQLEVRG